MSFLYNKHDIFAKNSFDFISQETIDVLNEVDYGETLLPFLHQFRTMKMSQHGNTPLLEAIAWNRLTAAELLIKRMLAEDQDSLFMKDSFASSQSTPLLLASKTGATDIALLLLASYQKNITALNDIDYLGNTALHYACLMRNNVLIEALIAHGANAIPRELEN